jgi:hypothetical protein
MLNKIKEFFTGKKPESKFAHPLDAVTTPKMPESVTETMVVMEPPKEQMIPTPYVPEAAPAVTTLLYVPPATEQAPAAVEVAPEKKARKPRAPKAAPAAKEKAPAKAKAPKAAAKSKKV